MYPKRNAVKADMDDNTQESTNKKTQQPHITCNTISKFLMYLNSVNQLNSMQPHDVKVYMNDSAHSKT